MKKIFAILSLALVSSLFAQEAETTTGPYEPVATEVTQAKNTDSDPLPSPKRPNYNFQSIGLGVAIWHNWEDSDAKKPKNEKRDWDQAWMLHYGRIWEMTTHGAITFMDYTNVGYESALEIQEIALLGGRCIFTDKILAPYVGAGIGLGFQYDGHFEDLSESLAVGFAGSIEAGVVIFRTSTTQLDLSANYTFMFDGFNFRPFGAFNFYIALNY